MRRVIGTDIHRTFGEVLFWEDAGCEVQAASYDADRAEGFAKSLLQVTRRWSRRQLQHSVLLCAGAICGAG